jgi:RNase P subunit RPR2
VVKREHIYIKKNHIKKNDTDIPNALKKQYCSHTFKLLMQENIDLKALV